MIFFRCLLERDNLAGLIKLEADGWQLGLLVAFTVVQFMFYSSLPYLAKVSSAAGIHLSLLATDVYVIFASVLFFNCKVSVFLGNETGGETDQ